MNGADLAVLVVPFLDGSSNRVEAGTDLEVVVVVFSPVGGHCRLFCCLDDVGGKSGNWKRKRKEQEEVQSLHLSCDDLCLP